MEVIRLNNCTLREAVEELAFQRKKHPEAHFCGEGNGNVVIKLREESLFELI